MKKIEITVENWVYYAFLIVFGLKTFSAILGILGAIIALITGSFGEFITQGVSESASLVVYGAVTIALLFGTSEDNFAKQWLRKYRP